MKRFVRLWPVALVALVMVIGIAALMQLGSQTVDLEGRVWTVYSDNPTTGRHRLDYYLHSKDGTDYSLNATDVAGITTGSGVILKGQYPYGMNASAAILKVPTVRVTESAPLLKNGGKQRWAAVMCKYSDHPEEPYDIDSVRRILAVEAPGMSDYWTHVSNGNLTITFDVKGWYGLDDPHYSYWARYDDKNPANNIYDVGRLGNACARKARADINVGQYDGVIFFFNFDMDGSAKGGMFLFDDGKTQKVMRVSWIPFWKDAMQAAAGHEIGHAESFGHSSDAQAQKANQLGNPWDSMGDLWRFCGNNWNKDLGCIAQYPMAYWRAANGWIAVAKADQKEGVRVFHIAQAEARTDSPQALFIPISGDVGYMLEVRRPLGSYDAMLPPKPSGAILTWVSPGNKPYPVMLIDTNVDSNNNTADRSSVLVPGTFLKDSNNITICVLADEPDGGMTIAVGRPSGGKEAECSNALD